MLLVELHEGMSMLQDKSAQQQDRHSGGSRQVSPSEPVATSSTDPEDLHRFPFGYAHIVRFGDGCGGVAYAVRMRLSEGQLDLIGESTDDLATARDRLARLYVELYRARWSSFDWGDGTWIAEPERALWLGDLGERPYVWGFEDCIWPHMKWQDQDKALLESLPERCPTIHEYVDVEGRKSYGIGWKENGTIPFLTVLRSKYEYALYDLLDRHRVAVRNWEMYVRPKRSEPSVPSCR